MDKNLKKCLKNLQKFLKIYKKKIFNKYLENN